MRSPDLIQAALFDHDGLLVDTQSLWKRAQASLFTSHHHAFGPDEEHALVGLSRARAGRVLARLLNVDERAGPALYDDLEALVLAEVINGCDFMPGAERLVHDLHAAGLPLGLASNSGRVFVAKVLASVGVESLFDAIVTADDVSEPKPEPEIYIELCSRLRVDVAKTVAFEDSAPGVAAAKGAGLYVVAVPYPGTTGWTMPPDLVVTSLADPVVREILKRGGVGLGWRA